MSSSEIDALLSEGRVFPPSGWWQQHALVTDPGIYEQASRNPAAFWETLPRELEWIKPWTSVVDWKPPHARWFDGGQLNACVNCVDRHARGRHRNKAAIIWEGEPGDQRTLTYFDLHREVSKCASMLRGLGVKKG